MKDTAGRGMRESIHSVTRWGVLVGAGLIFPVGLEAQTTVWTGNANSNFEAAASWSGHNKPGVGDTAVFNNATPLAVNVTADNTIAGMTLAVGSGGLSLNLHGSATLTVQGGVTAPTGLIKDGPGTLVFAGGGAIGWFDAGNGVTNQTGGTMQSPEFVVGSNLYNPDGTLALAAQGTSQMTDGALVIGGQPITSGGTTPTLRVGDYGGTGTFTQSGGTVTVGNATDSGGLNLGNQGGTGTYNLSGGTLTLSTGLSDLGRTTGTNPAGSGILNLSSGGLLELVDGASLIIGDRDGSGAQGTGTLNQTGGTLRVTNGSLWLSGYGAGTYNLNGGTLEVGGTNLHPRYGDGSAAGAMAFNLGGGTIKVIGSALVASTDATLTATTTSTIDTNGLGATWSGAFSGAGGLTKTGVGTLTLNNATASSFGQFLANQGTVTIASALTASGADFVPTVPNTNLVTHRNALVVQGGATMNLASGANVAVKNDVNTAFLRVGFNDTLGATLNLAAGATLQVGQPSHYANFIVGDGLGASGTVNQTGGTMTVLGSFNLGQDGGTGTYTISGGTLTIDHDSAAANHCTLATLGMNMNLATNANAGTSIGSLLVEGGTVNVTAHIWDPVGHPGVYGATNLILGNRWANGAAGNGSITQTGGVFQVDNPATLYLSSVGNGTYNLNGGTLEIGGTSLQSRYPSSPGTGTYAFNFSAGTIKVIGSSLVTSVNLTLQPTGAGSSALLDTNGYNATLSGNIATTGVGQEFVGGNGFRKVGSGTLTLGGTSASRAFNTIGVMGGTIAQSAGTTTATEFMVGTGAGYSGAYVLNGGSIAVFKTAGTSYAGSLRIGDYSGTGTFTQNAGTVTVDVGSAFHLGNQGGTGTYNLVGGNLVLQGGINVFGRGQSGQPLGQGTLNVSGGTLTLQNGSVLILGNNFSGAGVALGTGTVNQTGGTLHVAGESHLYVSGYGNGTYNLTGGTLEIGGTSLVARYNNTTSTYAFNLGGGTVKVIGSALTTDVATTLLAGTTSTIDTNGFDATFNGAIGGSGNLAKQGLGTLLLGGSNTYSGTTFVNAGTLKLGAAGALSPNTTLQIAAGAAFDANGFTPTIANLSGTGQLDVGGGSLAVQPTGTNAFDGQLTGGGGLTMAGTGTLVLNNANTYAGSTEITKGTVKLGHAGALPADTPVQIASGATLDLNDHAAAVGRLAGSGNVALGHANLTVHQSGNSTFAGTISGSGGLAKSGNGVLTFTGTGTFTGPTSVTGGGLKVNGSIAQSPVTVTSGGVLSGAGTVGNLTLGAGGVLSPGNSPGTLNAGSTIFGGGGSTIWEINQATGGTAGGNPGWDLLNITGTLTITSTSSNRYTFTLQTLDLASGLAGLPANFDSSQNYSFVTAATTGGIIGFSTSAFTIDTTGVASGLTGTWSLEQSGNNLNLVYSASAVPEPSTYAALLGAAVLGAAFLFRRRLPRPV